MGSGFNLFKNWVDITPSQVEQWVPLTVEGLVPPGATGVILRLANQGYGGAIGVVRKAGSSDDFTKYCQLAWVNHSYVYCGIDESQTFEAYIVGPVRIYLCGYTDEAVVFFANAIETPLFYYGWSRTWRPFDASPYVSPDATGAIWLVYCTHPTTGQQFSIRGFGSTDQHHNAGEWGTHATHLALGSEASNFCYALCALGEGKKIEFVDDTGEGYLKLCLVGYTKSPVTFFLNCIEKTTPRGDSWSEISVPEAPSANGVIVEIRNTSPGRLAAAIREKGSSNDDSEHSYLGLETAFWGACGLNEGKFEALIPWRERAYFIHGYSRPSGVVETGRLKVTSIPSGAEVYIE